jgi:hypothetical protein
MSKKNIVFTLCAYNYIAQAIVLGNSFRFYNPDIRFVIGLVDRCESELYVIDHEILPVSDVVDSEIFSTINKNYDIVELSTAVKPHYFDYFLNKECYNSVIYLDPDICVYSSLNKIFNLNNDYSIIVTPHYLVPPSENNHFANEISLLSGGVYNLGFACISDSSNCKNFLDWWKAKSINQFYANIDYFTDQLWFNCVNAFVSDSLVLRHVGCNVARWNFHERDVSIVSDKYVVNGSSELVFFHFSGLINLESDFTQKILQKLILQDRHILVSIIEKYVNELNQNNLAQTKSKMPFYGRHDKSPLPLWLRKIFIRICIKVLLILKYR